MALSSTLPSMRDMVFELPMRDGNYASPWLIYDVHHVFELPMRDGNALGMVYRLHSLSTFLNFL